MIKNNKISNGMRIGIDCRLWDQGGVGRYIRNLVLNLLEIDEKNQYSLFVRPDDENKIRNQISEFKISNFKFKIVLADIRWHSIAEQVWFPKIISQENVDLMHFTYQLSAPIFYKRPFVVTIHDLVYHHFVSGEASTKPLWLYGFKMLAYRLTIKSAVKRAKKIIAVSNFTKRDIVNMLGAMPEKIEVIYEAADDFQGLSKEEKGIGKYLLYVGNVYPHKNVGLLIEAFKTLLKENQNLKLILVGKDDFFSQNLKKKIKNLVDSRNVIFKTETSDEELGALYNGAICLIRPSLMEGFSLPPLEALQNRCLVLASDIPTHREIFGDSVIYFDQFNINDLVEKMNYVLSLSKEEKNRLLKRGSEKSKEYSWSLTARQTLKVYEETV